MIILINYDSKQAKSPNILQKGLFIVPKVFDTTDVVEEYLLSNPKLPFDTVKIVDIDPVPQDLSVPQETQTWLKTVLGREESYVPIELFESVPLLALSNNILKPEPTILS